LILKGSAGTGAGASGHDRAPANGSVQPSAPNETERLQEVQARIEKARAYEDAGQQELAKVFYQQAAARATGQLKQKLVAKIRSLAD